MIVQSELPWLGEKHERAGMFGNALRDQFPIFAAQRRLEKGRTLELSFLDSAASAQKFKRVIERQAQFLRSEHANVHRGAYALSANATEAYEAARAAVAGFINAPCGSIVFTRGTTESINLVAYSLERWFQPKDVVLVTTLEHHSNIVPWQLLSARRGVQVKFVPIGADATIDLETLRTLLEQEKPRLLACTHVSNAFGTVNPIGEICRLAHAAGCKVLVDAAQSISHTRIDVGDMDCDFLAFSAHKLYGPTGIGALYVRPEMYACMEPFQGGGDMIERVTITGSTWGQPPQKFEAGTPAISEALAFGTAVQCLQELDLAQIAAYEQSIFEYGWARLRSEKGVTLYGPATNGKPHTSIIAFNVEGVHPHDVATIADSLNVQIRAGHHCAMPALQALDLPSSVRASIGVYTRKEDFEMLCEAIGLARKMFLV